MREASLGLRLEPASYDFCLILLATLSQPDPTQKPRGEKYTVSLQWDKLPGHRTEGIHAGRGEELEPVMQFSTLMGSVNPQKVRFSVSTQVCFGLYWLLLSWYNLGMLYTDLLADA